MEDSEQIAILAMGGTIDKLYTLAGELQIGPPAATRILETVVTTTPIHIESIIAKDSLDLTSADREVLLERICRLPVDRIVITHGTDTMTSTAEHLQERDLHNKTIVVTGALQPAAMSFTDAHFNLGFAIAAARTSPPGVYIAMGARILPARRAVKNPGTGEFVLKAGFDEAI